MENRSKTNALRLLAFSILTFGQDQIVTASEMPFFKAITTCGLYDQSSRIIAAVDFETNETSGQGSVSSKLPQKTSVEDFPFPNAIVFGTAASRFRIATEVFEQTYANRKLGVSMAIYEEQATDLLFRAGTSLSAEALAAGFRYSYDIPKSNQKITCVTNVADNGKPNNKPKAKPRRSKPSNP